MQKLLQIRPKRLVSDMKDLVRQVHAFGQSRWLQTPGYPSLRCLAAITLNMNKKLIPSGKHGQAVTALRFALQ